MSENKKETQEKPTSAPPAEPKADLRYIVRISGKDLNGELPIHRALQGIKGISHRAARNSAIIFEKETGTKMETLLGKLDESMDSKLEDIVQNPGKHNLPSWTFNRRKDIEDGQDRHVIMADLDFAKRKDLQRLNEIKSYRGLRLSWGLPVRGQRTKSTHRGKGGTVGVRKKDNKK